MFLKLKLNTLYSSLKFQLKLNVHTLGNYIFDASNTKIGLDLVFVVPSRDTGWILKGIAEEIKCRLVGKKCKIVYLGDNLPKAKTYFFMHYMFFYRYLCDTRLIKKKVIVWVTHFESEKHKIPDFLVCKLLSKASSLVCTNSTLEKYLVSKGMSPSKLTTIIGGADDERFLYDPSIKKEFVGLSSAYYERKSPDKIFELVKLMSNYNFLLLGKNWEKYPHFNQLNSLTNFTYLDIEYDEYPKYYSKMKVFLSLSTLEGGPIPLIEAMFCNAFPVVTDTGFARDVINEGINGFIIAADCDVPTIVNRIGKAYEIECDVSSSVIDYSWDNFVLNVNQHLNLR